MGLEALEIFKEVGAGSLKGLNASNCLEFAKREVFGQSLFC